MIKLEKPVFDQEKIIMDCIANMNDGTSKNNITNSVNEIVAKSAVYDKKACKGQLSTIKPHSGLRNGATKTDMKNLYERKFVPSGEGGRKYYDAIKLLAPNQRCPYCAQREVSTLDHYLPKSQYPTYAITAYNLVPSCAECNKGKSDQVNLSREDESIHPYYDDFSNGKWIKAKMIEQEPIAFEYMVECPDEWDDVKKKRAKKHFERFELNKLYKPYAAEEYISCLNRIKRLYVKGGKQLAIEDLTEQIADKDLIRLNTWQAAMYQAIIENEWFWDEYMPSEMS